MILDMTPAPGSVEAELLRLGLLFDSDTDDGRQVWCDYVSDLRCEFAGGKPDTVTFTDLESRITRRVPASELANVESVRTWHDLQTQ